MGAPDGLVDRVAYAARGHNVVLLYQNAVKQAEAVIGAAAVHDGLLLEASHQGRRLASVADPRIEAVHRVGVLAGDRCDPRESLHEIERHPLAGQYCRGVSLEAGQHVSRDKPGAIFHGLPVLHTRFEHVEDRAEDGDAAQDAVLLCGQAYPAPRVRGHGQLRGDVALPDIFPKRLAHQSA